MESDADFLSRYWEELNWDTDDADFDRLFTLARRAAAVQDGPQFKHIKRGGIYTVIGSAELQSMNECIDGDTLTIYRDHKGELWARPEAEFSDGRFMPLPPPPEKDTQS